MLTNTDTKVLYFLTDDGSNPYELASGTKLTASEVQESIRHLRENQLVESVRDTPRVKLTEEGKRVRRSLSGSGRSQGARALDPQDAYTDADEASLDAALDQVIERASASAKD